MNNKQLQDKVKIYRLFELGHFYNPNHKQGFNVIESDLDKLTLDDDVVKDAIRSFQDFMIYDFERLSFQTHGRGASCDGECCEATEALFEVARCSYPDYSLNSKVGTGSWPEPCQKGGITYSFDPKGMPSKFISTFEKNILDFAVKKYGKIGANLVKYNGTGQANIRIYFRSFGGSTIGLAEFNSESCSDSVFCSISSSFAPNEPTEADLLVHELGHCMNLSHTRGGTMNPSIINQTEFLDWLPSDPSYSTLVRYFGGEPILPPTPTIPVTKFSVIPSNAAIDSIVIDFTKNNMGVTVKGVLENYALMNNRIL